MGLKRVRPTLAYYYVYPLGRRELTRLAYFFDFDYEDGRKPETYIASTQHEILKWRAARFNPDTSQRPRLDATIQDGGTVHVKDSRECAVASDHWLAGLDAELLLACDSSQGRLAMAKRFSGADEAFARLLDAKLAIEMDGQILSLPVLRNRPAEIPEKENDAHGRIPAPANPEPLLRIL